MGGHSIGERRREGCRTGLVWRRRISGVTSGTRKRAGFDSKGSRKLGAVAATVPYIGCLIGVWLAVLCCAVL